MPFQSVGAEMHRFKQGQLHSGKGGPIVKDRQQAIAISLSEERQSKRKKAQNDGAKAALAK